MNIIHVVSLEPYVPLDREDDCEDDCSAPLRPFSATPFQPGQKLCSQMIQIKLIHNIFNCKM